MAVVLERELREAWADFRDAGGVIRNKAGSNFTASAGGAFSFANYANAICMSNVAGLEGMIAALKEAANTARMIRDVNDIGLQHPRCFSRPVMTIWAGCHYLLDWEGRDGGGEVGCAVET
jgi:hypothetical protein